MDVRSAGHRTHLTVPGSGQVAVDTITGLRVICRVNMDAGLRQGRLPTFNYKL